MATESQWTDRALDAIGAMLTGPVTATLHTGPPRAITGLPKVLTPDPLAFLDNPGPFEEVASRLVRDLDWLTAMVLQRKAEMGCLCELEGSAWDADWRAVTVRFRNEGTCLVHRGMDPDAG